MKNIIDNLIGRTFGSLTIIEKIHNKKYATYLCKCSCGNQKEIVGNSMIRGLTKSCGCLQKKIVSDNFKKHGCVGSKEYNIWKSMNQRCHNPNNSAFKYYGEKGINVCKEWRNSFETFLKDMGNKPEGKSLDRINNEDGYSKENCRWADKIQQMNNRSNNRMLTLNNTTQNLQTWAEQLNINHKVLRKRLKDGWSDEDILTNKIIKHGYRRENKEFSNTI